MNNHFADVGKKDTMSLNLALIILDRLDTTDTIRNAGTIIEAEV